MDRQKLLGVLQQIYFSKFFKNISHENKKSLSPFYHKKMFSIEMNVSHPMAFLFSCNDMLL